MNNSFLIPKDFLDKFDAYWWYENKYAFWDFDKLDKIESLCLTDLIEIYYKAKQAFPQLIPIEIGIHLQSPDSVWKRKESPLLPEQWLDKLLASDENKNFVFEYDGPLRIYYAYEMAILEDNPQPINILGDKQNARLYVYWGEFVPNLSIEISLNGNLFEQFPYRDEKGYEIPLEAVTHNRNLVKSSLMEFEKLTKTRVIDFGSEHPWGRLSIGEHGFI